MPLLPRKLEVTEEPIGKIRPYEKNAREHPESQIQMLVASISKYGFNAPLLVNSQYDIIAGHGRLIAAQRLGYETVPVIMLPHLTPAQERAYRLADNAIMLKGSWSLELLVSEFELICETDLSFNPIEIGFETVDFDGYLAKGKKGKGRTGSDDSVAPPDRDRPAITQPGDLWLFGGGRYRLLCGDARNRGDYATLMQGEQAAAVFTDMPFNVPVNGHVSGNGKVKHPEFAMASGEMSPEQFAEFMSEVLARQVEFSRPGAVHFQCIDWRSVATMVPVGLRHYDKLLNICVWVKPVPGMGMPWRSQHEMVCAFRVAGEKHKDNVRLGKHGRNRSNIWQYQGATGFSADRMANLEAHPTCKPIDLVADAIQDVTDRSELILDPFLGSGTTIVAAHSVGRRAAGMEIDPYYVDVAVRRITERTGMVAKHADGRSFDEVETELREDNHG